MSSDEAALLAAICNHPDDDTIRLIYADWLEEHGQITHADFIRTQIDLSNTAINDPLRHYVVWRNKAHEHTTAIALRRKLPELPGLDFGQFVRGFAEDLHVDDVRTLRTHASEVFGTCPIRSLRVRRLTEPALLADTPELGYIRRLNLLFCQVRPATLAVLLASPYLTNLVSLELDSNALRDDVIGTIEGVMENLPSLCELWLGGNAITDRAATQIAASPRFSPLRVLDLSNNAISAAGAQSLAESKHLNSLSRLILKGCGPFPRTVAESLRKRFGAGAEFRARR